MVRIHQGALVTARVLGDAKGPARHCYDTNGCGRQKRSFFRQGACKTDAIELDQVNSIREANTLFLWGGGNQVQVKQANLQ